MHASDVHLGSRRAPSFEEKCIYPNHLCQPQTNYAAESELYPKYQCSYAFVAAAMLWVYDCIHRHSFQDKRFSHSYLLEWRTDSST